MATNRKLLSFSADYGYSEEVSLTDTVQLPRVYFTGVGGVAIDANSLAIVNVPDPVNPQDPATKAYADQLRVGIDSIDSCRAFSNTNIANLTGTMTVDGVALAAGDRVLLAAQSDATKNGVWLVQSGAWTRPNDFANGLKASGKHTFIEASDGTFGATGWVCNTQAGSDVVGTNSLNFVQFSGLGEVTAGNGLTKSTVTGNTISISLATNPGLQFTAGALDHQLQPSGSLTKDATGLGIQLNGTTLNNSGTGLRVLGLPSLFTIAGNPTDANVTATALNTLCDGPTVQADAYHTHLSVLRAQALVDTHTNGATALANGDPVYWSSAGNTLARGDASSSASSTVMGIVLGAASANANAIIVKHGIAKGVGSGLTPGGQVFLATGGGLTQSIPTAAGSVLIALGTAANATDVDVCVKYIGRRASS